MFLLRCFVMSFSFRTHNCWEPYFVLWILEYANYTESNCVPNKLECLFKIDHYLANRQQAEMTEILIDEDLPQFIDDISEVTGLSLSSCQQMILEDLKMRRNSSKALRSFLTDNYEKKNPVNICQDFWERKFGTVYFIR